MAVLVDFISDYASWIYAACGIAALFLLRVAILARRERRQSAFNLEREAAVNRTHGALRWALLLLAVIGIVYFISNYLDKAVEPILAEANPTPTPVFLIDTPTPTAAPTEESVAISATSAVTPTATATPRPRATPVPIPTDTPLPQPPTPTPALVVAPSCPDGRAIISQPGSGQRVGGAVQIMGTAQTDGFQYYKIEFKPSGAPGDFSFYLRQDSPVVGGFLGTWNAAGLPPGEYTLRLVTVDATGNFGQCSVQVVVGG